MAIAGTVQAPVQVRHAATGQAPFLLGGKVSHRTIHNVDNWAFWGLFNSSNKIANILDK
jgi:hypothetical protein